jgi:hypothetical protein
MNESLASLVRYFVATGHSGGWLIFREGRQKAVHRVPQKFLAVETARIMARESAPSQVFVERYDGTFEVKYSFGPASAQAAH